MQSLYFSISITLLILVSSHSVFQFFCYLLFQSPSKEIPGNKKHTKSKHTKGFSIFFLNMSIYKTPWTFLDMKSMLKLSQNERKYCLSDLYYIVSHSKEKTCFMLCNLNQLQSSPCAHSRNLTNAASYFRKQIRNQKTFPSRYIMSIII